MSELAARLGIDLESPSQRRAVMLAENDANLLRDLVLLRKRLGLTQGQVAGRIGNSQASVAKFERYDNDPKLSTLRRYAHAIGAVVRHAVDEDRGQFNFIDLSTCDGWDADVVVRLHLKPQRENFAQADWAS